MMVIGYGWVFIGVTPLLRGFMEVYNLNGSPEYDAALTAFALLFIFGMLLFVLPGLVVGGIGSIMGKSK